MKAFEVIHQMQLSITFLMENQKADHKIFNAESYLHNYGDLKSAFGNDHNLAKKHFIEHGFAEGRVF